MIYADKLLKEALQKEIPVLQVQIKSLYKELDKQFHLHAAELPITFGFEKDLLGSYTRSDENVEEHFHFSLLFIGYSTEKPLSKEDREDLYKHEYAHYMQYHMEIPEKYRWQPGIHGSAWKYCCSLVGAVPTPYYKAGEALLKRDYEKKLKSPIHDKTVTLRDNYRREKEYKDNKNRMIQYHVNDMIEHPKFGQGIITAIVQQENSVRLEIEFKDGIRNIDQAWLLKQKYKSSRNL